MEIYTDGSCHPNPGGPGGWAFVRSDGYERIGHAPSTTNNRMELIAILEAMRSLPNGAEAVILSDSKYAVNGLTKWHAKWKRNNWKRKMIDLPNADIWRALDAERGRVRPTFMWVRGHGNVPGNVRADKLANVGRKHRPSIVDVAGQAIEYQV